MPDPFASGPGPKPQEPSHHSIFERVVTAAKKAGAAIENLPQTPVGHALTEFAALPSEGINAALGAAQRVQASRIANAARNPRGVLEASLPLNAAALLDPAGRRQVGNDIYAAFHPNDASINAAAEHATGVDRLLTTDPRFRGKLRNLAIHTAFQTLTDPTTFAGAGFSAGGERALQGIGRAGTAALHSTNEPLRNLAQHMLTNVAEREGGFTPQEISKINALRNKGITQMRQAQTADEALLARNKKALQGGVIPPEIRQRFLREAYVYGTPKMRTQALLEGYKPTIAESNRAPEGILNYDVKHEYDPHTGMMATPGGLPESVLLGQTSKRKAPVAGFEQHQEGTAAPASTLYQRVEDRLGISRGVVRHRGLEAGLSQHLGVSPELASSLATEEKQGRVTALRNLSQAQVDALISTGIPHVRNVAIMGYNAMGEQGMARAMQFMTTGIPKKLAQRLEESGGASHFGVRTPGKYSPARLLPTPVRRATTGALDRFDQAVRAARLEQVDREFPQMSELEKMDRVNQDIGAYNQRPAYVNFLSGAGANFPQWHNYVVPTAVGRALLRAPQRVERLARVEQNANDTFLPNEPYRVTLGGPNDEAASAAADVARVIGNKGEKRYPTYFGGPSSIGPWSLLFHPYGSFADTAKEVGANLVPFGNVGLAAAANVFKSPLPPAARAAGELAGIYTQKRPPGSLARTSGAATPKAVPSAWKPGDPVTKDPFASP